jgi:predicted permease
VRGNGQLPSAGVEICGKRPSAVGPRAVFGNGQDARKPDTLTAGTRARLPQMCFFVWSYRTSGLGYPVASAVLDPLTGPEADVITLLQDMKFALRQMFRSPGFALTAILILALGIAANVIVFGVLKAIILEPINVPRPDRVMTFASHPNGFPAYSYPEIRDVSEHNTVFSAVGAEAMSVFGLEVNGITQPAWGNEVSGHYFEAVAIKPALGRLLGPADDDHPGASEAVVLSWPAWKSLFGGDPGVIGKVVRINKHRYTVVGVTEEGFYGTWKFLQPSLFVPMANEASLEGVNWRDDRMDKQRVFPIARFKNGVTASQAQSELNIIAARIAHQDPKQEEGLGFWLAPPGLAGRFILGPARRFLAGVMGLAGIVLLAACANLGGLFAARTADRAREIAIRMAVGSSRWRVIRQILVEALIVSILGGVCACALSWAALTGLAQWHPPTDYPIKFLVAPRPSLYVAAFLISVLAGVVFGMIPLHQIFKADPNDAIKSGSQSSGGRGWTLRDVLLAAQIALCCVTVTAAFVSLRGLGKTLNMNLGINPRNAVLTKFDLAPAGYSSEAAERFQQLLQERLAHQPGVETVGYASETPLESPVEVGIFSQETTDLRPTNKAFDSEFYDVSAGYFTAAQTPILEGRPILASDTAKMPPIAVVNQQFALHLFHTQHVVGRYFKDDSGKTVQIVGVATEGKYFIPSEDPDEAVFFPILQRPIAATSFIIRLRPNASAAAVLDMAATARKTIRDLDPAIPIRDSSPWYAALGFSFFPAQVATISLGIFGAFGLLLSVTGTFGLASYTVGKRMRELSIRVALGAQAGQILSAALGRMLVLLGTGSALGMLLGLATSHVLSHIVYQATAQDPVVFASVALTILLTGALSVAGPVRRALHVDPAHLLREQ